MSGAQKTARRGIAVQAAPQQQSSRVRDRAWRHLRRLLSAGAITGATLNLEACPPVVCDPLPPPLECSNNPSTAEMMQRLFSDVRWLQSGTDMIISATMQLDAFEDPPELSFDGDPVLTYATLLETTHDARTLEFSCQPDSGVTEVLISIPVSCKGIDETLLLKLDLRAPPEPDRRVAVDPAED